MAVKYNVDEGQTIKKAPKVTVVVVASQINVLFFGFSSTKMRAYHLDFKRGL